jgi:hypothetical protein
MQEQGLTEVGPLRRGASSWASLSWGTPQVFPGWASASLQRQYTRLRLHTSGPVSHCCAAWCWAARQVPLPNVSFISLTLSLSLSLCVCVCVCVCLASVHIQRVGGIPGASAASATHCWIQSICRTLKLFLRHPGWSYSRAEPLVVAPAQSRSLLLACTAGHRPETCMSRNCSWIPVSRKQTYSTQCHVSAGCHHCSIMWLLINAED